MITDFTVAANGVKEFVHKAKESEDGRKLLEEVSRRLKEEGEIDIFAVYDAEWFPYNSTKVNLAWMDYVEHGTGAYAINALRIIVNAGLSLPDSLMPWIVKACDAWCETKGNKQQEGDRKTSAKWESLVIDVYLKYMAEGTIDHAVETVAAQHNGIDDGTLRRRYFDPKYKNVIDAARITIQSSYNAAKYEGEEIKAGELEKKFPKVFREKEREKADDPDVLIQLPTN